MKVVVCRCVEVHQSLLPELHHGDCGEDLGDGPDTKDGVLGDRHLPCNIGETVSVEPREGSVTDHRDSQAGGRPAVEGLSHRRLQVEVIDPTVRGNGGLAFVEPGGGGAHRLLLLLASLRRRRLPTASG